MAYALGFFAADGTMIKNNRGAHFIEFHITDRCILVALRRFFSSNHKIALRKRKKKQHKPGYRLQIGSRDFFSDLSTFGFTPNKSKIIRFPDIPKLFFGDFVRGYFDGDGCIYFRKHWVKGRTTMKWVFASRFTCGSRPFLHGLLKELQKWNVKGGCITSKSGAYELILSHRDSVALYHLMYNNVSRGMYLPRKFRLFQKALRTLYGKESLNLKMRP